MNGMIAADYSVMVFSSDIFAIAGYDNITLVIRDIKEILGINIHIGMAILNRRNNPSEKKETLLEKIQHLFGLKPEDKPGSLQEIRNELEKRIQTEIPEIVIIAEGKEVSQSIKKGIPLITMAPDDPAMPGFTRAASIIDSWRIGGR